MSSKWNINDSPEEEFDTRQFDATPGITDGLTFEQLMEITSKTLFAMSEGGHTDFTIKAVRNDDSEIEMRVTLERLDS